VRDSKITFRVSDDLLERVDEIEESRSEIMREALRTYLEGRRQDEVRERKTHETQEGMTLDGVLRAMIRETVDEAVEEAVEERLGRRANERENVNVTVNVPDAGGTENRTRTSTEDKRDTGQPQTEADTSRTTEEKTCHQCGEEVADEHVHCPNCGAKTAQRLFCDCGDEIRSDWSFCPSCGRRTPTSHALSKE
jgi:Arc/MetJ-type ribon-helix-helix transcriptional regulator